MLERMARAHRKPIVWAFSLSRLSRLLESIVPHYEAAAEVRVFRVGLHEALETLRRLTRAGDEVDVLVSAGWSGAVLREHAELPVVVITPTGLDILQALSRARQLSTRVGIVTYGDVTRELAQFKELYGLEIDQRAYANREDAEASVRDLAARGVEVVVGPGLVTELAEAVGLKSVFIYSRDSVHDAMRRAIEIARVARTEEARRERIDAILSHLAEGVVAVDGEERVQSINPAMQRLLGVTAEQALGARLSALAPTLGLGRVLQTGGEELESIQKVGKRLLVTNRIPLQEHGVRTGAVLTCQDATAIERADRSLRSEHRPRRFVARYRIADLVGESDAAVECRALAGRYARTEATVLITGESGTGKEVVAQGIHEGSARRERPFVAVNCAAFPETLLESELFGYEEGAFTGSRRGGRPGLFEAAHTGTIFLDEVGDVPLPLQSRLLRVLQEREVLRLGSNDPTPVDVRVLAATNRDLAREVDEGRFRKDLYYRLAILRLHLPPLAARRDDVAPIARHLLTRALARHGSTIEADEVLAKLLPRMTRYAWPGNIRELDNVLERIAVLCAEAGSAKAVRTRHLASVVPELFRDGAPPPATGTLANLRRDAERERIARVLQECGGDRVLAAKRLGIGRTTLWRKLTGRS
jgi:transcriptional regulator, propionate catabolism operon regulatory protein